MSKNKNIDFSKVAAHIIKTPLQNFVEESYLPYAHYVIMNRALISDDGLKPVQRRILYAMDQLGLTDKKDFIKAAQIVGETMGKYHPHGDASIGDALARMGQDFTLRVPLVDVQGSVGFTTGDDPAAPRYWEGRPTKAAMELTKELKEGAIKMGLNYDGKYPEPPMLPVRWPNGIINGSQGIAVGYSSNIVPHNPTEVMDALIAMVKDPDITIDEIMEIMPGPDMPTGGVLIGYEGVKDYYETGKGTFSIRGKYSIEPGARGTHQIIFHEAPYQVSAEQIISAVDKNKKDKNRFKEISQVKDLSDINNGFKLSVSVKAGANPEVVLSDLFKWTPLEQTFSVNMTVLKDGVPSVNSMKDMLENFIEFRSQCIIDKSQYRLNELNKEIDRLDGIIKVLVDIDKAIEIIRKSEDTKIANEKLQKRFKINDEQATFILSMPLRRLTKSDSLSIQNEIKDLKEEQKYLTKLLKDEKVFKKHLINELEETKKVIADERRTEIINKSQEELKKEAARLRKAAA
ncbi:MAG: DNA topoisomerase IV, partial [Clostridiaceae bacterium]|nr:DNA topoisomerase IV [Clostridiaceae bacterium]